MQGSLRREGVHRDDRALSRAVFLIDNLLGLSGKCDRFFYIDIIDTLSQKGKETLKRINDSLGDSLQLRIIEYQREILSERLLH